ncbi:hypothetical protein E4N62_31620 [Streptomyces sp. MNU76]|uniref:hypothetical protein n=1 Tax=Streptomyces sp. MNU76 TaxID=2560026 RepID=UPI001E3E1857|nr:hypothetical protein [Streptomyces sp. MNU76]MCC9709403.1 hypothetical protein [Streptomyces sp. MNU76]
MLDLIVRPLARMLGIWLPHSRGRHRAGPVPVPSAPTPHRTASPRPPGAVTRTATPPHSRPLTLDDRVRRRATRGLRERRRALW